VRQRRGLTVTQLGKMAELSPSAISQIENGILYW
jgi:transcriptional regulator with XRE-family HTH domain